MPPHPELPQSVRLRLIPRGFMPASDIHPPKSRFNLKSLGHRPPQEGNYDCQIAWGLRCPQDSAGQERVG
jgi:hypothetical protein